MTPEPKEIGHQIKFNNTLVGLIRKGFWHIPEVMLSSCMALVGVGLAIAGVNRYYALDGDNREFKSTFVILRPEDPQACKLKNPVYTSMRC